MLSRSPKIWAGSTPISSKKKYLALAEGDVLFRSVETANPTCLVSMVPNDRAAIAHQHFLHIRLHDDGWDPAFLTLLLNSERMQTYFRGRLQVLRWVLLGVECWSRLSCQN